MDHISKTLSFRDIQLFCFPICWYVRSPTLRSEATSASSTRFARNKLRKMLYRLVNQTLGVMLGRTGSAFVNCLRAVLNRFVKKKIGVRVGRGDSRAATEGLCDISSTKVLTIGINQYFHKNKESFGLKFQTLYKFRWGPLSGPPFSGLYDISEYVSHKCVK